jgi:hypothetical protein
MLLAPLVPAVVAAALLAAQVSAAREGGGQAALPARLHDARTRSCCTAHSFWLGGCRLALVPLSSTRIIMPPLPTRWPVSLPPAMAALVAADVTLG